MTFDLFTYDGEDPEEEVDQPRHEEEVYSVTELTRLIRYLLSDAFPQIYVKGEISNLTLHRSGHY